MDDSQKTKNQKIIDTLKQYIGKKVFVSYYRQTSDPEPCFEYVIVSDVTDQHLMCFIAHDNQLIKQGLSLSNIQYVAKDQYWYENENESLYYFNQEVSNKVKK